MMNNYLLSLILVAGSGSGDEVSNPPIDKDLGEYELPNEAQIIEDTKEILLKFLAKTYPPGQQALRDFHTKHHGCVEADFNVLTNLPSDLVAGAIQPGATYHSIIRFSNGDSKVGPDILSGSRGMAIKVFDVEGERLLSSEIEGDQDFAMINRPSFFIANAYENLVAIEARENDRILQDYVFHGGFRFWNWHLAGAWKANERNQIVNPLHTTYFSMTPYRLGNQAIKFRAAPCDEGMDEDLPENPTDNYLRENMKMSLKEEPACFQFQIQRRTDPKQMPIENARKVWKESLSPFVTVAEIRIASQDFDTDQKNKDCEDLSFSPWNGLKDHKPLGSLNRVRRVVYEASAEFRRNQNAQMK